MRTHLYLAALLVAAACGGGAKETETGTDDGGATVPAKAAKAATIANEIAANPDDAEAVLKRHGLTAAEFEALMYEIAEDEELSEAYERARR